MDSDGSDFELIDAQDYTEGTISTAELNAIRAWLQPTDYDSPHSSEYRRHLASRSPDTGIWVRQSDQYCKWTENATYGCFGIKGVPGSGKSVLAASLIQDFASATTPVLSFFFRQIIAVNRKPRSLLRDWLAQLLPYSTVLQSTLHHLVKENPAIESVSVEKFWQCLEHAVATLPRVYCVADALDEADDGDYLLEKLVAFGKFKPSTVKVLITGRPVPHVETAFHDPGVLSLRLDQVNVDKDIERYVTLRLAKEVGHDLPQNVRETISSAICDRGRGLFLYARLMMDTVVAVITRNNADFELLHHAIENLPVGLDEMYTRMLKEHATRLNIPQSLQLIVLNWVIYSNRPLRLLELTSAIHSSSVDGILFKDRKLLVRKACGPLVEVLEDETLQIIHHSFTEFLRRTDRVAMNSAIISFPVIEAQTAHHTIATTCMRFLLGVREEQQAIALHDGFVDAKNKDKENLLHPALKDYAEKHWHQYVASCGQLDKALLAVLGQFFSSGGPALCLLKAEKVESFYLSTLRAKTVHNDARVTTPLHAASAVGLSAYIAYLLDNHVDNDINLPDEVGDTPLARAALNGHYAAVQVLLNAGANPNVPNDNGLKPMHHVSLRNHAGIVKLLLGAGVSPLTPKTVASPTPCGNTRSDYGDSPLRYAALAGHSASVIPMLPLLEEKDLVDALHWTIQSGNEQLAMTVLNTTKVSPDAVHKHDTALFVAAKHHLANLVRALLEKGADPHKRSLDRHENGVMIMPIGNPLGFTPIHGLARKSQNHPRDCANTNEASRTLCLLLDAGIDINSVDDTGVTALLDSTTSHYFTNPAVTELLLKNGANPAIVDKSGRTPLGESCQSCTDGGTRLRMLLKYGAPVNPVCPPSEYLPIFMALKGFDTGALKILLEHEVNWSVCDPRTGNAPIHVLLSGFGSDIEEKLEIILSQSVDITVPNKDGNTCLHMLRKDGHGVESLMKKLIHAGVNLESRNHRGETVLLHHLRTRFTHNDYYKDIDMLVRLGVDLAASDNHGRTALHIASRKSPGTALLQKLIDLGVDPCRKDNAGNTLVHHVTEVLCENGVLYGPQGGEGCWHVLDKVVSWGLCIHAPNNVGQTALHLAAKPTKSDERSSTEGIRRGVLAWIILMSSREQLAQKDHAGRTALHFSATGSEFKVKLLLDAGLDPISVDFQGRTALHYAAKARAANNVAFLANLFSKCYKHMIDHIDHFGRAALHDSIRSGVPESIEALLLAGADPNRADKNGIIPLNMCCYDIRDEEAIWAMLRHKGQSTDLDFEDLTRPTNDTQTIYNSPPQFSQTYIRDITRLLLNHGAIPKTAEGTWHGRLEFSIIRNFNAIGADTFDAAISSSCWPVILEMRRRASQFNLPGEHALTQNASRKEAKVMLKCVHWKEDVESHVVDGKLRDNFFSIWHGVDALYDEELVKLLDELDAPFLELYDNRGVCAITFMAQNGLSNSLRLLPRQVELYEKATYRKTMAERYTHGQLVQDPQPLLIKASERHITNLAMFKLLVEELKVDVNAHGTPKRESYLVTDAAVVADGAIYPTGPTVVHYLAQGRYWWHLQALEYLLSHGADPNALNEEGKSPLHFACDDTASLDGNGKGFWREETISTLLKHGARTDIVDADSETCLSHVGRNVRILRTLLEHGAKVGKTSPLLAATQGCSLETMKMLLDAGFDCNIPIRNALPSEDEHRRTMLFSQHEPTELVYPLLQAASPARKCYAVIECNEDATPASMMHLLLQHGADITLSVFESHEQPILHHALSSNDLDYEAILTYPGLDLNLYNSKGETALIAATRRERHLYAGNRDGAEPQGDATDHIIVRLIAAGANPALRDCTTGRNILHHMLSTGGDVCHLSVFEALLELPSVASLVRDCDNEGYTPLHIALANSRNVSRSSHIRLLLSKGAELSAPDPKGNTPLHHLAPFVERPTTVDEEESVDWEEFQSSVLAQEPAKLWRECLDLGVDINARNHDGDTPMLLRLQALDAERLYEASRWVDRSRRIGESDTAWRQRAQPNMSYFFIDAGADVHAANNKGETALHCIAGMVNPKNGVGPYKVPVYNAQGDVVKDLYEQWVSLGLDPWKEDIKARTSLDLAAENGHDGILAMFRRKDAGDGYGGHGDGTEDDTA